MPTCLHVALGGEGGVSHPCNLIFYIRAERSHDGRPRHAVRGAGSPHPSSYGTRRLACGPRGLNLLKATIQKQRKSRASRTPEGEGRREGWRTRIGT